MSMQHTYWLFPVATSVYHGWACGKPNRGKFYEYEVTVDDLARIPAGSQVYVNNRLVRR